MSFSLFTDLDGTLLGESASTSALRSVLLEERQKLAARGERLYCAVATGRRVDSTREALLEAGFQLDDFDALITSVGAELYWPGESAPCPVYAAALGAGGFDRRAVLDKLGGLGFLRLQPDEEQLPYKVSYFMADTTQNREAVHAALAALPFATETVISHDEYLDIAPRPGGKGSAVAHLLARWKMAPARAVAAGDSGNDLNMLTRDWHGIVVGNGSAQLAALRERPSVYFANAKHAAGVLEGLCALGFLQNP